MEPDDLLCSRNARSQKSLVGRAQWKIIQPPSLEITSKIVRIVPKTWGGHAIKDQALRGQRLQDLPPFGDPLSSTSSNSITGSGYIKRSAIGVQRSLNSSSVVLHSRVCDSKAASMRAFIRDGTAL